MLLVYSYDEKDVQYTEKIIKKLKSERLKYFIISTRSDMNLFYEECKIIDILYSEALVFNMNSLHLISDDNF